ncbi:unnamed protein product [Amoebophrya sp. A120]|nr:unnamed protein product [Amoebophrya sp. A120]|eukprot:GSA120T00014964001.1
METSYLEWWGKRINLRELHQTAKKSEHVCHVKCCIFQAKEQVHLPCQESHIPLYSNSVAAFFSHVPLRAKTVALLLLVLI